jgi:hypothetical protein
LRSIISISTTNQIPTYYPTNNNNPSVIDLCFSKGEISDKIIAWSVNHDLDFDHSIIGLHLQGIRYNQLNRAKQIATKRRWSKADWLLFAKYIQESEINMSNLGSAQEALCVADAVTTTITEAIEKAIPKRKETRPICTLVDTKPQPSTNLE